MKAIFRKAWSRSPKMLRYLFGKTWRARGAMERMTFDDAKVESLLSKTNLFFLLGSGRCGTMFLTTLLSEDERAVVKHEPRPHEDLEARVLIRRDPGYADQYIANFRRFQIYKYIKESGTSIYGEASSPLRCVGGALRSAFPHAHMFILARDGRATVRSALNRQMGRNFKSKHVFVSPLPGDPMLDRWDSMSSFAKICWWWMDSYRLLLEELSDEPIVHFEKVLNDYDYFESHVLAPIGLNVSRAQWDAVKARKTDNSAQQYRVPHWREWSAEDRAIFEELCGPTMERLGYGPVMWS